MPPGTCVLRHPERVFHVYDADGGTNVASLALPSPCVDCFFSRRVLGSDASSLRWNPPSTNGRAWTTWTCACRALRGGWVARSGSPGRGCVSTPPLPEVSLLSSRGWRSEGLIKMAHFHGAPPQEGLPTANKKVESNQKKAHPVCLWIGVGLVLVFATFLLWVKNARITFPNGGVGVRRDVYFSHDN